MAELLTDARQSKSNKNKSIENNNSDNNNNPKEKKAAKNSKNKNENENENNEQTDNKHIQPKQNGNNNNNNNNNNDNKADNDDKKEKKMPRYQAERVIGSGSFGIVYKAIQLSTRMVVAIKKVREDRRYKNRELQIMKLVKHPNVVTLVDCFYSKINRDIYLNLVMEYIPESLYFTIRHHAKAGQTIPFLLTKLYFYQICRAIAYCHQRKICHRDIKPQNLLVDPDSHAVKLCDFGSAKKLNQGEPNVAYICSRYYRAPELIFEYQFYETAIDLWSLGCVLGELFLGTPLFQGEKSVDQLVEIIKVLGTPTQDDIKAMNPDYQQTKFPVVKSLPWRVVFATVSYENQPVSNEALDLISKFLVFAPKRRIDSFEALAHPYFDELRDIDTRLLNGNKLPPLFNFTEDELRYAESKNIKNKIVPKWYVADAKSLQNDQDDNNDNGPNNADDNNEIENEEENEQQFDSNGHHANNKSNNKNKNIINNDEDEDNNYKD